MTVSYSYIKDKKGRKTAVRIPISEWENLISDYRKLLDYKKMKLDLSEAIAQVREYESGKKKPRTLKQFLNNL